MLSSPSGTRIFTAWAPVDMRSSLSGARVIVTETHEAGPGRGRSFTPWPRHPRRTRANHSQVSRTSSPRRATERYRSRNRMNLPCCASPRPAVTLRHPLRQDPPPARRGIAQRLHRTPRRRPCAPYLIRPVPPVRERNRTFTSPSARPHSSTSPSPRYPPIAAQCRDCTALTTRRPLFPRKDPQRGRARKSPA